LGDDFTWTGGHEFDASIDITGNVAIDGDLSVDGTAAFTDASFDGTVDFGDAVAFGSDVSFDGTVDFGDGVAFGAEVSIDGVLKVDNTSAEFGGTTGIGLFFDPTVQGSGAVATTLPNGLILKCGSDSVGTTTSKTISYASAFPNDTLHVFVQQKGGESLSNYGPFGVSDFSSSNFVIENDNGGSARAFIYFAIGY
jgi:hypothetical protein